MRIDEAMGTFQGEARTFQVAIIRGRYSPIRTAVPKPVLARTLPKL